MEYDVVIIGAGPSGLTAGIYVTRAGLKAVILERQYPGGQATLTYEIENYPGFLNISGADLINNILEQAQSCGVEIIYDGIKSMNLSQDIKEIETVGSGLLKAKAVILCNGANPRKIGLEKEEKFIGRGISYCATCDGAFYKNKTVAIIGGGNTAVEDALYLTRFAAKVYIVHRRQEFKATKVLVDRLNNSAVEKILDATVTEIIGDTNVSGIEIEDINTKEKKILNVDGIFVAIGQIPANDEIPSEINRDKYGYVITDEDMRTNIDGVYCAGDIRSKRIRQIVTACSDGAIAGEMASLTIK